MVESINESNSITEGFKPEIKKVSLTKTIRFNESEIDLWENWDKDVVKKIKTFLREQLTYKQAIRSHFFIIILLMKQLKYCNSDVYLLVILQSSF